MTNLGYSAGDQPGSGGRTKGQSNHSESAQSGTNGRGHSSSSGKTGGQTSFGLGGAQGTSGMKQLGQRSSSQPGAEPAERPSSGRKAIASGSNSTHFGIGGQSAPASSGQEPKGARFVVGIRGTGGATQVSQGHGGTPRHSADQGSRKAHLVPGHDPGTAQAPASDRSRAVAGPTPQGQPKAAGQRPQQGQQRELIDRRVVSGSAQRPPGSVAPTQPAPKSGRGAASAKPRAGRPVASAVINHKREPKE